MQSNLLDADPQADPHDAIAAQLRDLTPRLGENSAGTSIAPTVSLDSPREPSFHPTPLNDNTDEIFPSHGRGRRVSIMLLVVCAGIAATAAWHAYGAVVKQRLAEIAPQFLPAAIVPGQVATPLETQKEGAQATASSLAHDATVAPIESSSGPDTAALAVPPAQATLPPDVAQSIETMTREIASLKQTVEQLQISQQQLSRDIAKNNEQEARRKPGVQTAKPAPRLQSQPKRAPTPTAVYHPPAPYPPSARAQTQTYSQGTVQRDAYVTPAAPAQLPPPPGDSVVPRPPMPLR